MGQGGMGQGPMVMVPLNQLMQMQGGGGGWGWQNNSPIDKSGGELGEFTGTIKSMGHSYGFIECPEAGKGDIFLHAEHRKGYKQGQTVKFDLVLNKDGKPNAIKLRSGLK